MVEAVVCASCPDVHQDAAAAACKALGFQKAFGRAGDMLDSLSGTDWVAKWEAKVVMATVTKVETLKAAKAKIICIAGGRHCDLEMGRQPLLVKAIKQELGDDFFRVKVEWLDFVDFVESYPVPTQDGMPESPTKHVEGKGAKKGPSSGGNKPGKGADAAGYQGRMPDAVAGKAKPGQEASAAPPESGTPHNQEPGKGKGAAKNAPGKGGGKASKGVGAEGARAITQDAGGGKTQPGKEASAAPPESDTPESQGRGKQKGTAKNAPGKGGDKAGKGVGAEGEGGTAQDAGIGKAQPGKVAPAAPAQGGTSSEGQGRGGKAKGAAKGAAKSAPPGKGPGKAAKGMVAEGQGGQLQIPGTGKQQPGQEGGAQAVRKHKATGRGDAAAEEAQVVCRECGKRFATSFEAMCKHRLCKGREPRWCCAQCGKLFDTDAFCLQHQRDTGHRGIERVNAEADVAWECGQCQRSFATPQACQQHQRDSGHGDCPSCAACGKDFMKLAALEQHQRATGHAGVAWLPDAPLAEGGGDATGRGHGPEATADAQAFDSTLICFSAGEAIRALEEARAVWSLVLECSNNNHLDRASLLQHPLARSRHLSGPRQVLGKLQFEVDRAQAFLFTLACTLRRDGVEVDLNGPLFVMACSCGATSKQATLAPSGPYQCTVCGGLRRIIRSVQVKKTSKKTQLAVREASREFCATICAIGFVPSRRMSNVPCPFFAAANATVALLDQCFPPPLLEGVASCLPQAGPLRELDAWALEVARADSAPGGRDRWPAIEALVELSVADLRALLAGAGLDAAAVERDLKSRGVDTKEELVSYVDARLAGLGPDTRTCRLCTRGFAGDADLDTHIEHVISGVAKMLRT